MKKQLSLTLSTAVLFTTFLCSFNTTNAASSATVTASNLNIRKGAGTKYAIISSVSANEKVTVQSTSGGWCKITYKGATGYVSSAYLKQSSSNSSSSSSQLLKTGSQGSAVKTLQNNLKKLGYFKSSATGLYGSTTKNAVTAFQKQNGLTVDGIAGSETLKKISSSTNNSPVSGNTNDTLKMGSTGSNVTTLQKALKNLGYLKVSPTGYYGSLTRSAVIKYQKDYGLSSDGIAGKKTLTSIYSGKAKKVALSVSTDSSKKSAKIEMPDWWSVASKVYTRGSTAKVTDVKTGISFNVRRYGGTNHADTEPLTAKDTAKMKQIYGGSWSWTRRAIYIEVNGRRFAASMNGQPHGNKSLSYNNFGGHFCIHFLNSRTHGSNSVDPAHQAAIQYAFNQGSK